MIKNYKRDLTTPSVCGRQSAFSPFPSDNCKQSSDTFSSKRRRNLFLLSAFCLLLLCLGSFTPLNAKVFEAYDFDSYKAAVDSVKKRGGGDTIKITANFTSANYYYKWIDVDFVMTGDVNPDGTPKYTISGYGISCELKNHFVIENIKVENAYYGLDIYFGESTPIPDSTQSIMRINNCIFLNNEYGIYITCDPAREINIKATISNCKANFNKSNGIALRRVNSSSLKFFNTTIINCETNNNGSSGIDIGSGINVFLKDCISNDNIYPDWGASGFQIRSCRDITLENCYASGNDGTGFNFDTYAWGHSPSSKGKVTNCMAQNNVGCGFSGGENLQFNNCSAIGNTLAGFAGFRCSFLNSCVAMNNGGDGFYLSDKSNIITNSTASNNSNAGLIDGFKGDNHIINFTSSNNKVGIHNTGSSSTKIYNSISWNNNMDLFLEGDGYLGDTTKVYNSAYGKDSLPQRSKKIDCTTEDPKLQGRTASGNTTDNPNEIAYYSLQEGSSALNLADKSLITAEKLRENLNLDLTSSDELWVYMMITEEYMNSILMNDQIGNIRVFAGDRYDAGAIAANTGSGGTNLVFSYAPKTAANFGKSTITFYGKKLDNNTKIKLMRQGESDIVSETIKSVYSATTGLYKCLATFNFHNKKIGKWDIVVTVGDTATETLKNGLEIEDYIEPFIETEIVGPDNLGPNKWIDYTVVITNKGNVDVFWVPVIISLTTYDSIKVVLKRKWTEIPPKDFDVTKIPESKTFPTPEGDGRKSTYIPPIIPTIPAKSKVSIRFSAKMSRAPYSISSPTAQLKAEALKPMNDNSLNINQGFFDCLGKMMDIVKRAGMEVVSTFVPGAGCAISIGTTAQSAMENYENKGVVDAAGNLAYDLGKMAIGCAGGAIPGSDLAEAAWGYIEGMGKVESWAGRAGLLGEWLTTYKECKNTSLFNGKIVTSVDPNDKYGPVSASGSKAFSDRTEFPYVINFENDPEKATAPAQEVWIIDTLDLKVFDINTFEAGFLDIGGRLIETPFGQQNCSWTVDMNPEMNLTTEVKLTLDKSKGIAKWYFKSIDPATGELPNDPMVGFLPPNDSTGRGQGSVLFTIKLKNGLADNVVVANKATIIFDNNPAIVTPTWENKKDVIPPSSTMLRPTYNNDNSIELKWKGTDNKGGSGVYGFDIYVKKENGNYEHLTRTFQTSTPFTVEKDVKYAFYSIATDSAGNREKEKTKPDITIPEVNLPFDDYAATKWNNTFMLNLKKLKQEGYNVDNCKWFKNNELIEEGFSYSAGPQLTDLLEKGAVYYFQISTSSHGEVYSTNKIIVDKPQSSLKAYPNPVPQGSKLTIEGTTQGALVELFNYMGLCVSKTVATDFTTEVTLSLPAGVYIVRSNNEAVKVIIH